MSDEPPECEPTPEQLEEIDHPEILPPPKHNSQRDQFLDIEKAHNEWLKTRGPGAWHKCCYGEDKDVDSMNNYRNLLRRHKLKAEEIKAKCIDYIMKIRGLVKNPDFMIANPAEDLGLDPSI